MRHKLNKNLSDRSDNSGFSVLGGGSSFPQGCEELCQEQLKFPEDNTQTGMQQQEE